MNIQHREGIDYITNEVKDCSVDLIIADPPYITSRDSGMNDLYDSIQNKSCSKTKDEWKEWSSKQSENFSPKQRENYLKYGTIYGKKYAVCTQYGDWDANFTLAELETFIDIFYKKLRNGGTCIIFFDLWKISELKALLEKYRFKQIRLIEWIKTNPQPLNSKRNYLTNCREIALLGVKKSKPTFNSKYDNGIYYHPIQGGKSRCHPTQKSFKLIKELIEKHSNQGDLVVDPFLGSGTTAYACKELGRSFSGCEVNKEYFDKIDI